MSLPPTFPDATSEPDSNAGDSLDAGSVSLLVDAKADALVVLHGAIGRDLHSEIKDLVDDLAGNTLATAGRSVRVLAENVTAFDLTGVWLLLELRRAARPATVTLVAPSTVVREAIVRHGVSGLLIEE